MQFTLPDKNGKYNQPNVGDSSGNVYATYGIDFLSNRGKIRVTEQSKKLISSADNANFSGYAGAIFPYTADGATGKLFAISDKAFSANFIDITGTWTQESAGSPPSPGNTVTDGVVFNGFALVYTSTDIKYWDGSTWGSYWQTVLGQAALTSGRRGNMRVGANGNLYVVNHGQKVYKVTGSSVTLTGGGTLDISASQYSITCGEPSSNRMWYGTENIGGGEAVIIEWDMSANSSAANKFHPIGSSAVRCIAIHNDVPIAILSNGLVKYFNGVAFVDYPNALIAVEDQTVLSEDFVHPNGWAIIDGLPHFLLMGKTTGTSDPEGKANWIMPAGVYCLDPHIGLYHRFSVGAGTTTPKDYGRLTLTYVGALYAPINSSTKFIASYEYRDDTTSTIIPVLAYHDQANTNASRGFLVTPFIGTYKEARDKIELLHKKLATGEKMKIHYRYENDDSVILNGAWASTTTFNAVATNTGIEAGYLAMVKAGNGAGQLLRVSEVDETATVTSLTLDEANTLCAANDVGVLEILSFKNVGTIDNTTMDYHSLGIPSTEHRRKIQFLIEFRQAAENKMELDNVIIN